MVAEKHDTESTSTSDQRTPQTARELFDALPPLPGFRAEAIEGKLIVSPLGSPEHAWMAMDLNNALISLTVERGWKAAAGGLNICIEGPRDSLAPDYVLAPPDCPRWGRGELLSSGVVMVAEVVSPSSVHTDREEKRRLYALGRVPVYLLIDPLADEPAVTVFSEIKDDAYQVTTTTLIGTPIKLPAPVDFELDTSIFKV
ncbi:Uma2 family endonuclease [Nonomuraea sp. K274]|uniref:Uma2 family endonuclease n=2 Tax=Nonomuraea cypriaca TaxID=1187855 RepID=A0A931A713_9ACTN|nr:Uma2 family endonuclease [Nonomuraea cypriaca]